VFVLFFRWLYLMSITMIMILFKYAKSTTHRIGIYFSYWHFSFFFWLYFFLNIINFFTWIVTIWGERRKIIDRRGNQFYEVGLMISIWMIFDLSFCTVSVLIIGGRGGGYINDFSWQLQLKLFGFPQIITTENNMDTGGDNPGLIFIESNYEENSRYPIQ